MSEAVGITQGTWGGAIGRLNRSVNAPPIQAGTWLAVAGALDLWAAVGIQVGAVVAVQGAPMWPPIAAAPCTVWPRINIDPGCWIACPNSAGAMFP
jgi:hypothetical protein